MIQPGAVFEVAAALADPPQRALQDAPPIREHRWVIVVSNKTDCRDRYHETVAVVLCSAKIEYAGRHDVIVKRPDGGMQRDAIAQTDLLFTMLKADLEAAQHHGTIMSDTLHQIRAKLADTLGMT